jgi:hypothetical protein
VVRVRVLYCDSGMREVSLKSTRLECYTSEVDPRIGGRVDRIGTKNTDFYRRIFAENAPGLPGRNVEDGMERNFRDIDCQNAR